MALLYRTQAWEVTYQLWSIFSHPTIYCSIAINNDILKNTIINADIAQHQNSVQLF